ncbi:phosphatase PAP2 family protein [Ferruginibacter sp. SUN106]|uniref:phosphatase PAP2 family protein n=1 Tax=Ferruginibacter sp. SUN106 TaxID=2978348 RepID=UPI003D36234A
MKKIFLIISVLTVTAITVFNSCSKKIDEANASYPLINPTKTDANAGTWKPILLTSASEFACAAPIATTSPDYILQLNEIKSFQNNITNEEKDLVNYWGAGAVLRWNEIMRELVAKHNLPPYQNPDGSYPFPNANNPLAYPLFPFSNPPYAARAYAYLSAAQYDACVAGYYYKSLYNRAAPFTVDATLQTLLPKSTLPSYPSEDAVVMGASVELLKLLFPGDQDFINQKAEEHKRARLIAGANVRSDLDAGEALGRLVASKFIARARGDRAGAAIGTQAQWTQFETDAIAKGETPWISQETPKRPPMLPLFGKVKTWLFDSLTMVTTIRPAAPPSTTSAQFKAETEEIYQIQKNLTREQRSIATFWSDGAGTYTPPGHWNYIAATEFAQLNFSEARWARNMALLNMSIMDAGIVCWDAKYVYFNPRPMQIDTRIKTDIGLPNFPAYISGHSTFSGAASTVLGYIIPAKAQQFIDMAKEASVSRMYGAIHFRSDCEVGLVAGNKVGSYAIARGHIDGAE